MAGVTIKLDDSDLQQLLDRVARLPGTLAPIMKNIGLAVVQGAQERFRKEQAPDGSPWKSLDPDYAASKRGPGILREMGQAGGLFGSLTYRVAPSGVEIGTNKVYAAHHQFGSDTLPARPFLGLSDDDRADILDVIAGHVGRVVVG